MDWIILAFIPLLLWAISNFIDKQLISKYFNKKIGALLIFSSMISVLVAPIVYFVFPHVINVSYFTMIIVILNSFLVLIYLFPYFWALSEEDTSNVIPLFETIPFFVLILAFFILGENLSLFQILAIILVSFGAFIISLREVNGKIIFKRKVLLWMLLASFLVALNSVIFKYFVLELDYWTIVFWSAVGSIIFGIILLSFKKYRQQFYEVFENKEKHGKWFLFSLNLFNEIINLFAWVIFNYAIILAPMALVWLVTGFQPIVVLVLGYLLTKFFPNLNKEDIRSKNIFRKILAIILMLIGLFLIQF